VFWWENLDLESKESFVPTADDFDSTELWDILNEAGISTGVVGMPLTYPPKSLDGFMIAGGPGVPDEGFATPESVEAELSDEFDYSPRPTYPSSVDEDSKETFIEESLEQVRQDFRVAEYLHDTRDVKLLQICSFEINGPLQHLFYDGEPTRRAWSVIDEHIGRLADKFDYVVIHSDHGTSPMDREFYVNQWLDENGYLVRERTFVERLADYGLNRDVILDALDRLGVRETLQRVEFLRSIAKRIPDSSGLFGETEGKAIFEKVDWDETKTVGLAQGPLYINDDNVTGDYESFRTELAEQLDEFSDHDSRRPIQEVFRREEVYHGPYLNDAPDLVALDAAEYHNKGGIGRQELFGGSEWKGNNARQGLYAISGPDVADRRRDAEIYDITPTILSLFGIGVPDDMDGETVITA
jgi:predicted AlkP superfamily phosphohydrolase/phosphomutase